MRTSRPFVPSSSTSTADREIFATRVFDALRDLVFQMFTDAKHVAHWWGSNGITNTISSTNFG